MQMNLRQSEERVTMPFQHQTELESKEKEFAELEERLSSLSVQEDAVIDPEEEADPVTETKEEHNQRIAEFGQSDADDVNPLEHRPDDDRLEPRRM